MKIKKICKQCGKEFEVLDKAKFRNRLTCSDKCRGRLKSISQKKINNKGRFKKGMTPWNKGINWPEMQGKNNPRWKDKIKVKCANCGKILERTSYWIIKTRHSFCNQKCFGNYYHNYPAKGVGSTKGEKRLGKSYFKKGTHYNPKNEYKKGDPYFKERYKDNRYLFNLFHGHLFPSISKSQLNEIDKKAIRAKILIHKIRRSLNVNK